MAVSHADTLVPDGKFLEFMDYVSNLDKSNWTFGYFGHGIETNAKLNFIVYKNDGAITTINSDKGLAVLDNAGDNAIRFYGFKARYSNVTKHPMVHDLYATSMGVYLINKYKAHKVEIQTERCVTSDIRHASATSGNVLCKLIDSKIVEIK